MKKILLGNLGARKIALAAADTGATMGGTMAPANALNNVNGADTAAASINGTDATGDTTAGATGHGHIALT